MIGMFLWLGVAVGAALLVFLFASVVSRMDSGAQAPERLGLRGFWTDFRSGLGVHRRRSDATEAGAPQGRAARRPVDTGIDELFAATAVNRPAYVDAEELTDILFQARDRAVRTIHVPVRVAPAALSTVRSGAASARSGVGAPRSPRPAGTPAPTSRPVPFPTDHDRRGAVPQPTRPAHDETADARV
ncbi:hypothetical protein [Oerskovia flava]|uniref:hypothetical protein n=1 Tax=Oerskovia flava TaxID=2986422 RepID=UPI00223F63DB|nr:hypothetical protein [Oerskovia sp. JB1-3-2]